MWLFIVLGVLVRFGSGLGDSTEKCTVPTLLYDSLKCTPVFSSTDDYCPSKYDCSHIEANANSNENCYFDGKTYSNGESVTDEDIYGNCEVNCTCGPGLHSEIAKLDFTCDKFKCPEWFDYNPDLECSLKYEFGKCCSVGKMCTSVGACEVNGTTVFAGSKFEHPSEKCSECICQEGFNGEFKEPFCRKRKCTEEISKQKEVYGFCAPSYILSHDHCCPFNWICPEESDQIEKASTISENKCKFGSSLLSIGDKFSRTRGEMGKAFCECRIPPYMTCTQNYDFGRW